jgi:hypothetical protein
MRTLSHITYCFVLSKQVTFTKICFGDFIIRYNFSVKLPCVWEYLGILLLDDAVNTTC